MTDAVVNINDAIGDAVKSVLAEQKTAEQAAPEPVAEAPAPAPEATDLEEEPTDEVVPDDTEEGDAVEEDEEPIGDVPALPDGFVAVPVISENLATEFALYDKDGEVEVPELMVEYKANGKVRKDRLDQVVKLAQWGVYNEERDKKAQALEQEYQQTLAARQELERLVAEREAQMERLLQDDNYLDAVRDAYANENSPERRIERAEREKENLRISYEMQQIQNVGAQFYEAEIVPAVRMITDALPAVTAQELESRLQMVMQAHAEVAPNGQPFVPPSRYDAIRQYIVEDLALWAQMVNAKRAQPASGEKAAIKAELDKARIEAQKAKNLVGKATKPTGQAGKPSAASQKAKPIASLDDAVDSALQSVLSSISS